MLNWFDILPVELVGTNVMGLLEINEIIMLERGCGSKKSHQHFLHLFPYCPPVELPLKKHDSISSLEWFAKRRCTITSLTITLRWNKATFNVKNLSVDNINLIISSKINMHDCQPLFESDLRYKVKSIDVSVVVDKEVIEQLSIFTENLVKMKVAIDDTNWLTVDILSRWKLKEIILMGTIVNKVLITLILQTCTEITQISLDSSTVDDAAVIAIAQHCPQLQSLSLPIECLITFNSLLALSDRGLPLKELDLYCIPHIPTADIAWRCSHALSCISHINTANILCDDQDACIVIPYMTGLTSVCLSDHGNSYIPLLTQHCLKLTEIIIDDGYCFVDDILLLCYTNPLLQELWYCELGGITDTVLIELIHACPHLHTFYFPHETAISDIGILALSEHCPQLQWLDIRYCIQVTEAAVLQLLQRCRKLSSLDVSGSSLSEETWTQLDRNTQKRVSRW